MKRSKRIMIKTVTMLIAVLLCLGSMIYAVPEDGMSGIFMTAHAVSSGQCGDNLTWTLDSKGTLTISGTGPMWDWNTESPWFFNSSVKSVVINEGVTTIGSYAFYWTALTSVTIPTSVTSINRYAFYCTSLASVTIPTSVTSIGEGAFSATCLTSVTIPNSVTSIGDYAFYSCSSLSSVIIPDSVTSIGEGAFSWSDSLNTVCYYGNETEWNSISIGLENDNLISLVRYLGDPALEAHSVGYTSAKLTWSDSSAMDGYSIYRCDKVGGTYKYITDVGKGIYTYTNTGLSTGTTYYYKVEGYYTMDGKTCYTGMSNYAAARPIPATPVVTANRDTSTAVSLSWAKIYGATGYSVYRSETKNGTYAFVAGIADGSTTTYKDTKLNPSKTYYYKVRAYRAMGTDRMFGNYSAAVTVPGGPDAPVITARSVGYTSVKVQWNTVPNATGYEIYRCDKAGEAYNLIASVGSNVTTYTNTGLSTGTTYYYKVRAYVTAGSDTIYSAYSAYASTRPLPATPVVSVVYPARTVVKLSWVKIYGATGYSVYRSESKNGTYAFHAAISSGDTTTFVDSGLTSGKTYYYKVRAYRAMGADKMFGNYSAIVTANVT